LHAYDAADLGRELYNSNQAPGGRDQFGTGNKFITPTVADGKVFVGTTNSVGVFGLLSGETGGANVDEPALTAMPNPIPISQAGSLGVTTISWSAPGAAIVEVRIG